MSRPTRLDLAVVDAWVAKHAGWRRTEQDRISKEYGFPDFASALAFVVRVGCIAEKLDHHPDIELGWGRVKTAWSTHDAGGITELDLRAADAADAVLG
jgi:4a-hydroxytetrahydrobiopterin dehydratase